MGQLNGRTGNELIADGDEARAEIEEEILLIALDLAVLGKAITDQCIRAVFFFDKFEFELSHGAGQKTGCPQDGVDRLRELLRIAHLGDERERRDALPGGDRVSRLALMNRDKSLIRPKLRDNLAKPRAKKKPARVLVELLKLFEILLVEKFGAVFPKLSNIQVITAAEHHVFWFKKRARPWSVGWRNMDGNSLRAAFATARHPNNVARLFTILIKPGRQVGRPAGHVEPAAEDNRQEILIARQSEDVLRLGRLADRLHV